jgi:TetR/AcrR family transcriptional regulator, transcriptional repressor for nem operon
MGRPKTYDADELVNRAMHVFWQRGYAGTSTVDLVEQLGVNKFSLYAEFGSKQALYEAALARYDRDIVTSHFGLLERESAGLAEILAVLDSFAQSGRRPGSDKGCFICNSATERGADDAGTHLAVEGYFGRIREACVTALENARNRGEVGTGFDIKEEASWITTTLLGLFVLMRAQAEPSLLHQTGLAAARHLNRLRSAPAQDGAEDSAATRGTELAV